MLGDSYDDELRNTFQSCTAGQELLNFLEDKYVRKEKKDVNRGFARFIAQKLETHRFDEWLSDRLIGKDDIVECCEGGNMNRL